MAKADDSRLADFEAKTGKSLDAWIKIVKASKAAKHGEIVAMLKTNHGLTHGFANTVAHAAAGLFDTAGDDLLEAQYAGPKAALRPLYDAVAAYVATLGADVEIAPKKTSVSFRRAKQFACAIPATKTRIDLGIQPKGEPATGRLEALKQPAMTSHSVKLESLGNFDAEVKAWLKRAYAAAG